MSTAFAAVALVMLIATVVGIVLGIFVRGRRRRGWKIAGFSLLAFFLSVALTNHTLNKGAAKQTAVALPTPASVSTAVRATEVSLKTEAPSKGAERFGAEALAAYCDGYQKTISVIREADEKFGIEGTDEKMNWINERDEAIGAETQKAIGAPFTEWHPVAIEQGWDQRCEGLARGWLLIEDADLLAAGDGDAHAITRTLQVAYEHKVEQASGLPFSRYRFARCDWKERDGYHFVACTLSGGQNGLHSDPYLYFVGKKDGASVIVPLDHEARDHMTEPSYRDIDKNRTVMPVGWYVGPLPFQAIPYVEVRSLFQ